MANDSDDNDSWKEHIEFCPMCGAKMLQQESVKDEKLTEGASASTNLPFSTERLNVGPEVDASREVLVIYCVGCGWSKVETPPTFN